MSVRVNLLPEATRQAGRRARQRRNLAASAVLLLAGLGTVHLWAVGQTDDARRDLAVAEARTGELRGQVNALHEFQVLARAHDDAARSLQDLLGGEYSLAGVFQDLATAMPDDAQFDSLTITSVPTDSGAGHPSGTVATFAGTGRTLASHAPGVERLVLGLERVATFRGMYVTSATTTTPDERYAQFTLEGEISPIARTGRYSQGLPERLR